MDIETRICRQCEKEKPISFFHKLGTYRSSCNQLITRESQICKDCAFKNRNSPERKLETKATKTISNHAKKLNTTSEQLHKWGITREYVSYLFQRELNLIKTGMGYCANCFDEEKGINPCYSKATLPSDLHLDIIDLQRLKLESRLTRSNIRVICNTANKAKSRKDPTDYDIEASSYRSDLSSLSKGIQTDLSKLQPKLL